MKISKRIISLFLALLIMVGSIPLTAISAFAEDYYDASIQGSIKDQDGLGVANVSVYIYDLTEEEVIDYYRTDASGNWKCNICVSGHEYLISYFHTYYDFETSIFKVVAQSGTNNVPDTIAIQVVIPSLFSNPVDYQYEIINGSFIRVNGYTGSDVNIAIPEKIDGYTVQEIGKDTFKDNQTIECVAFPTTVEKIGDSIFSGCVNIKNVYLTLTMNVAYRIKMTIHQH